MPDLKHELELVLDDVSYLLDELDALQLVVDSVPVFERPGGELSIAELFKLIDFYQNDVFDSTIVPILGNPTPDLPIIDYAALKSTFEKNRDSAENEAKEGITVVIDTLKSGRIKLLKEIEPHKSDLSTDRTMKLANSLNILAEKERGILKSIAEHILTITRQE